VTFEHKARILAVLLVGVNACTSVRAGPATQERVWPAYLGSSARVSDRLDTSTADPQPVWRAGVGRGIVGAPALAEDIVALAQVDQQVVLLDRATGDVLWRRRIGGHAAAGPLIADDRLLAASQGRGGAVVALRLLDGRRLWSTHVGDVVAPLALDGGTVYAGTSEGWVVALDARTGRPRWRVRVPGAVRAAPVPLGTAIAVATTRDSIFLLEAFTATW
jgi:outer membrane protein assembly factor BamB